MVRDIDAEDVFELVDDDQPVRAFAADPPDPVLQGAVAVGVRPDVRTKLAFSAASRASKEARKSSRPLP